MKITQEVCEFAAQENAGAETFLAANDVEEGMATMSERFKSAGAEIYLLTES